ncbi:MAG: hypothetical protein E6I63_04715 [Chloroflexi bacterium]|nr:MAG: hypothetical protein E6I63_04715 [Chloroflexota bacterium]
MYRWVLLTHIWSVFGFLFAHGGSVFAALQLRKERRPEPARALLRLSEISVNASIPFLLLLTASGIALGFMGSWWSHRWVWASIAVFLLVSIVMGVLGGYRRVRGLDPATPEEFSRALDALHPNLLLAVGVAGLVILVWLMYFKPF